MRMFSILSGGMCWNPRSTEQVCFSGKIYILTRRHLYLLLSKTCSGSLDLSQKYNLVFFFFGDIQTLLIVKSEKKN